MVAQRIVVYRSLLLLFKFLLHTIIPLHDVERDKSVGFIYKMRAIQRPQTLSER